MSPTTTEPPTAPTRPALSIVVVAYDMARELPRTHEVVVVDNGSPEPVRACDVEAHGPGFRLVAPGAAPASPVGALEAGFAASRGEVVAFMIDGARIPSPDVAAPTIEAFAALDRPGSGGPPCVTVPSWHLGPDVQNASMGRDYCREVEDLMPASVDWRGDGYQLFELCERLDPSSEGAAWFAAVAESNFVAVRRAVHASVGGFDAGLSSAGGGLANLDYLKRLVEDAGCRVASLFGEGTFHQIHGGISTNAGEHDAHRPAMAAEYEALGGRPWTMPDYVPVAFGSLSKPARDLMARSPNLFTYDCGRARRGARRWDGANFRLLAEIRRLLAALVRVRDGRGGRGTSIAGEDGAWPRSPI